MLTAVNKTCSPLAACPTAGCYDSTPAAQDNVCRHNAMLQSMRNFTFFSAEIMLLHPSACSPGMTLAVNDNLCGHETVCVTNSWNTFAWQWKPCHETRDTLHHNINTVMSSQTVHVQVYSNWIYFPLWDVEIVLKTWLWRVYCCCWNVSPPVLSPGINVTTVSPATQMIQYRPLSLVSRQDASGSLAGVT